jgi:alanine dehydrogenase
VTETLIFSGRDVAALLPLRVCIAAVEEAFRALGTGAAAAPAMLSVRSGRGGFHVKAGILARGGRRYFAAKTNANFPDNPELHGLPTIQGVLLLLDADSGAVLAVMDSVEITALRTAAATAVAARHLARADSGEVMICGCGVQGRVQLRALAEVMPLTRVHAVDVRVDQTRAYAREMAEMLGLEIVAHETAADAAAAADVCVTCTTGSDYVLDRGSVRRGTLITGIGVDSESKRELTPQLLASASKIVTDLRSQCAQIGDLHHAIAAGLLEQSSVHADLGEVVAGTRPGRETAEEIIVFDSTGLAVQDVAAAAAVYERYLELSGDADLAAEPYRLTLR